MSADTLAGLDNQQSAGAVKSETARLRQAGSDDLALPSRARDGRVPGVGDQNGRARGFSGYGGQCWKEGEC